MRKKGQISVFIIIGIIILVIGSFAFYYLRIAAEGETEVDIAKLEKVPADIQPVQNFVYNCLKDAVKDSIYDISKSGGYYFPDEDQFADVLQLYLEVYPPEDKLDFEKEFFSSEQGNILYYYYEDIPTIPSREEIEQQFSKYIRDYLYYCADLTIFEDKGYQIQKKEITIKSSLINNQIIVDLKYPLTITKGGKETEISKFSYAHKYNYDIIINSAQILIYAIVEEPFSIDKTLLLDQYYPVSIIDYDSCNDIYMISDYGSMADEDQPETIFRFAIKFKDQDCLQIYEEVGLDETIPGTEDTQNVSPILEPIQYQKINVGDTLILNLKASDLDNGQLFYITRGILKDYLHLMTGVVNFTPNESHIGLHYLNVTVVDIESGSDTEFFYLEVT